MVCDEKRLADEEIELGGAELVLLAERDRVHDEEEVILVVLDLGVAAFGETILDRQRMKGENVLENHARFLRRGGGEVHPDEQALVGAHQPQGVTVEIAGDKLAVVEDERLDHKAARGKGGCTR